MHRSQPELRIIDEETWNAVQSRVAAVRAFYTKSADGKPKGRALAGKPSSYPFSGILRCGTCGALLGETNRRVHGEVEERRARLQRTEQRIADLVRFIAEGDHSDYVRTTLKDLEAQVKAEKHAIADLLRRGSGAVRLPSPEQIVERAFLFEKNLLEDPVASREELRRMFEGEQVLVRPQPGDFYIAEGTLLPLNLFSLRLRSDPETPKVRDPEESADLLAFGQSRGLPPSCSSLGCPGAMRGPYHDIKQSLSTRLKRA